MALLSTDVCPNNTSRQSHGRPHLT